MSEIKLGDRVRDVYTGFEGTAVAHTTWLYGCARFGIEPTDLNKDGKVKEAQWFDEQRVELVEAAGPKVVPDSKAATGGPQADPVR